MRQHTGQVIGGVSPLGHPAPVPTYLDSWLRRHDVVWAAAGHPAAVFSTTYDELRDLTGADRDRRGLRPLMDSLALVFSSGWASGVNAYLVVLVLGIADRVGDLRRGPRRPGPVGRARRRPFVLYAMEFVADKIPYVDSTWDASRPRSGRPSAR